MLIVVDFEKNMYEQIQSATEDGRYGTVQDYIKVAVINQIELEKAQLLNTQEVADGTGGKVLGRARRLRSNAPPQQEDRVPARGDVPNFNRELVQSNGDFSKIAMVAMRDFPNEEPLKIYWLWGQVNRILGMKIGLRILANLERINNGDPISISSLLDEVPRIACAYGTILNSEDAAKRRKRGDKLATGLPLSEKGIERYKKQILFTERKRDGYYSSAIINLGFADIDTSNRKIALTEQGLSFSLLQNPVLDGDVESATRTLSDEECNFYIDHVRASVPPEWDAIIWVLAAVGEGIDIPTKLDERLQSAMPQWTPDMVVTQRSGAIGRSLDLGLLGKTKDGVNVTYRLSDFGKHVVAGNR